MSSTTLRPSDSLWTWEVFLLGGGSILTCMACWAFTDKSLSLLTVSQFAFGLAFAINHPHFLSSYMLLYRDFGANIRHKPRYVWAAIIAPALIAATLVYAIATARVDVLGHCINAMYFLVGWHYVKQVFGCVVVTSARRQLYYRQWERRLILSNLFSLWGISFLREMTSHSSFTFYGITYAGWPLAPWLFSAANVAVWVTAAAVVGMHLQKYLREGAKPSTPGLVAMAALYVWYLPALSHPAFAYLIPMFHSLQYLAFVWSFKTNQVTAQLDGLPELEWRKGWVQNFLGYAAVATMLGALAFEFVPKGLDAQGLLQKPELGTSPFLVAFLLFINIHHYFIDNVIWRSDNEQVRKYLFAPPTVPASAKNAKVAA